MTSLFLRFPIRPKTTQAKRVAPPSPRRDAQQQASNNALRILPTEAQHLQRAVGNHATGRLLQAKLTVGPADDKYEQEADRTAQQVMRAIAPPDAARQDAAAQLQPNPLASMRRSSLSSIRNRIQSISTQSISGRQRGAMIDGASSAGPIGDEAAHTQRDNTNDDLMQTPPGHGRQGGEAEPGMTHTIEGTRGSGQPLNENVRASMELGFGADFSAIRVHTDGRANTLNRSLNSRAFTTGGDIFFRSGEYNPESRAGQKLIAHELTHTVQQGAGAVTPNKAPLGLRIQRKLAYAANYWDTQLSKTGKIRGSTVSELSALLKKYHSQSVQNNVHERLACLQDMLLKLGLWAKKREEEESKGKGTKQDTSKAESINHFREAVEAEIRKEERLAKAITGDTTPEKQEKYMKNRKEGAFQFVGGGAYKPNPASKYYEQADGDRYQRGKQLAQNHNLSKAEFAAIRTYTGAAYDYMNPILAQNEGWLKSKAQKVDLDMEDPKAREQIEKEALKHTRNAVSGLKKLPDWKGTVYRGLTLPEDELLRTYKRGGVLFNPAFGSTSTDQKVSFQFAMDEHSKALNRRGYTFGKFPDPKKDKAIPVRVLLIISVSKGKDIEELSTKKSENEILLPPGTQLKIDKVTHEDLGKQNYRGYTIHATQIA